MLIALSKHLFTLCWSTKLLKDTKYLCLSHFHFHKINFYQDIHIQKIAESMSLLTVDVIQLCSVVSPVLECSLVLYSLINTQSHTAVWTLKCCPRLLICTWITHYHSVGWSSLFCILGQIVACIAVILWSHMSMCECRLPVVSCNL
jgi:hypothetical protein